MSIHFTLLLDNRASTQLFHCTLAVVLASVQDFHIILAYSCYVGHQILFILPIVCCPCGFQLKSSFFCGTGMLVHCVSDPLPFLQFDSQHHGFLFCAHQHLFIREKIRPEELTDISNSTCLLMCDWNCVYGFSWSLTGIA
jgi:hypothetical protein